MIIDVDVYWRPFQLNSHLPFGDGVNKMEMYQEKFGSERIRSMIPYMKQVGTECGINFSYGGNIGNTFDSHRLIWKSRTTGGSTLQNSIVEELFKAYFEREQSLGSHDVLQQCAIQAGMSPDIVQEVLESNIGKNEVLQEKNDFAKKYNCRGVPLFIIEDKYPLSGAQPPEAFIEIFQELVDDE